jgi:hypothetical protein
MAQETISTEYFINPHQSVSVCASLLSVLGKISVNTIPRQRIRATIEELLDTSFSVRSVCYQRESVGLSVYPLIVAR